jgi:hypothetical protein
MPANYAGCRSLLVARFGELIRKLWNRQNFKGQVSPHEFMQASFNRLSCFLQLAGFLEGLLAFSQMEV